MSVLGFAKFACLIQCASFLSCDVKYQLKQCRLLCVAESTIPFMLGTNGCSAGQSNGWLPGCNGNQWWLTVMEWSDPDGYVSSNVFLCFVIQSQPPECSLWMHANKLQCASNQIHMCLTGPCRFIEHTGQWLVVSKLSHKPDVTLQHLMQGI